MINNVFLIFEGNELEIYSYLDASFQLNIDYRKSQSGYVFTLNGGAVSWKSSKQETIVDYTIKAEYIFTSETVKKAIWIKKFITELSVVPNIIDQVALYCDNNRAIAQTKEPRSHQRSKYVLR
jgi:hypothetical protein